MDDLIKRLEEAKEGSRELDHAIACYLTCGPNGPWGAYKSASEWQKYALTERWASLAYTTSLDAALTLVPEGHCWQLNADQPHPPRLAAMCKIGTIGGARPDWDYFGEGSSPSLALCIAALRTRSQEGRAAPATQGEP